MRGARWDLQLSRRSHGRWRSALGQTRGTVFIGANQVGVVRVVLVPATALMASGTHRHSPRATTNGLPVVHAVADRPSHGKLAGQGFAASLAPQRAEEDVAVFLDCSHHVLQDKKQATETGGGSFRSNCCELKSNVTTKMYRL